MYRTLLIFLVYIATYHISTTVVTFGIGYSEYNTLIPIIRDGVRGIVTLAVSLLHRQETKKILQQTYKRRISLIITCIFAVTLSQRMGQSRYSILVGIKYGFLYLIILLASIHLGSGRKKAQFSKFFHSIGRLYIIIVSIGRIRQGAKYLRPDFFLNIGYGPIGDFAFGENPPIYYRTGPGGDPRRQGIFSGPNNYGYFLVATLPFILYRIQTYIQTTRHKRRKHSIVLLRTITIFATLSRAAILGLVICLLVIHRDKRHKQKKIFISLGIVAIIAIGAISIYKGGSTLEHINQKRLGLQEVINAPLGYGLGTAGPAIHHNGTMLPENYYLQLMLDIGTLGFILRTGIIASRFLLLQRYKKHPSYKRQRAFFVGILALFILGFFLHVFEDSMVNYLIFIPYALSISALIVDKPEEHN